MSRRAQIEEVDDDPDDFDITEYDPRQILNQQAESSSMNSFLEAAQNSMRTEGNTQFINQTEAAKFKHYQLIYPLYFDKNRSREDGRRVGLEYAVENPLAQTIVDCLKLSGLQTIFEPTKTHPKDWANPGRVRVLLKENGIAQHPSINTKRRLMQVIGTYMKENPTNENTPLRLRLPGLPPLDKPPPAPPVPRGWKVGTVLPIHSAALTGGGVSDNILKDMMQEMGGPGGAPGGMAGLAGLQNMLGGMGGGPPPREASPRLEEGKKKKDKKGKK